MEGRKEEGRSPSIGYLNKPTHVYNYKHKYKKTIMQHFKKKKLSRKKNIEMRFQPKRS